MQKMTELNISSSVTPILPVKKTLKLQKKSQRKRVPLPIREMVKVAASEGQLCFRQVIKQGYQPACVAWLNRKKQSDIF